MSNSISRREFLKLSSLTTLSQLEWQFSHQRKNKSTDSDHPNVIVLLFDTLSAFHLPIYGYQRDTAPNLSRFAEQATVYHSHYSAGNFTTPGTASILTGTYPWTNRALHLRGGVKKDLRDRNIFQQFDPSIYTRFAFSHNELVTILLDQFKESIDVLGRPREFALADQNLSDVLFPEDYGVAIRVEGEFLRPPDGLANSPFFHLFSWLARTLNAREIANEYAEEFPRGVPENHGVYYLLEDIGDWLAARLNELANPFLAYVHLMPPHDPYNTRQEFVGRFYDEGPPKPWPKHFFDEGRNPWFLLDQESKYDEFIAYVDDEFGKLIDRLSANGTLDNTWFVFTSDHGELFERGIWGHHTQTLFDPVIRVPLLISAPGQKTRQDVHTPTSSVDLLPTMLQVTGQNIPDWIEGEVLPPYSENITENRSIFSIEAKSNPKLQSLDLATLAMIKDQLKTVYYKGYEGYDGVFEVYDLAEDRRERRDISANDTATIASLKQELLNKLDEVNEPFQAT